MRLDKILRNAGISSRKETRHLINEGRITVNGMVLNEAHFECELSDDIRIDGKQIEVNAPVYIIMNKPGGYVCATSEEEHETVIDLLDENYRDLKLFPVGRLDKDTEGLLILTNDGDFCRKVIRPESGIVKTYYTEVSGEFVPETEKMFKDGITFFDGTKCSPGEITISSDRKSAVVKISEGKTHQVKRMVSSCGARVRYLKRLGIGKLSLPDDLKTGSYREMTDIEKEEIFKYYIEK